MGAKEFGALVERRMAELEISQNRLASRLGELEDGRIFDATQVRLIREGRRRLDHVLVAKLIDLLDIDPAEGWAAAGLLPAGVDAAMLRRLGIFAARPVHVLRESLGRAGQPVELPSDLDDALIRRLTPRPDRRQRDRRFQPRPVGPQLLEPAA